MFGIGVGKMEMKIPKTSFTSGEEIEGTLYLTVNKPVKANGVFIRLYAEQERQEYNEKGEQERHRVTIYDSPVQLEGAKEYGKTGEPLVYPFKVKVPPLFLLNMPSHETIGLGIGPLKIGIPRSLGLPRWYLQGYLDLPFAFDVKTSTELTLT